VVCASLKALNEPEGSTHRKLFMHIYRNYPINTNKKKVVSKMMMILKRGEKRGLWKKIVAKRVLNNRYKLLKDISGEGTKKRKKLAIGGQWPQLNDATYNSSAFVSVQGDDPGASPPRMERDALQTIPPGAEDHPLLSGVHFMAGMQEGPGAGETSRSEQTPKEETDSDDEDAPLALARHRHKKVTKRAQEVKEEEGQDEGGDLTFDRERFEAFKTNRQRELKELFGDAATDTFIKKTISSEWNSSHDNNSINSIDYLASATGARPSKKIKHLEDWDRVNKSRAIIEAADTSIRQGMNLENASETRKLPSSRKGKHQDWMFGNNFKALSSYRKEVEGKPKASYHKLIADAIIQSNVGFLSLNDIYEAIQKQHPYYAWAERSSPTAQWKNSIRHNLSLLPCFQVMEGQMAGNKNKVRAVGSNQSGKGGYWMFSPEPCKKCQSWMNSEPEGTTPQLDTGRESFHFGMGAKIYAPQTKEIFIQSLEGSDQQEVIRKFNQVDEEVQENIVDVQVKEEPSDNFVEC